MKPEIKKLLILNLPYLLFVWLFDKVGAAVRLSPGADASAKLLHLGDGFTAAFSSIAPSFHPADLSPNGAFRRKKRDGRYWSAGLSETIYFLTPVTDPSLRFNPEWVEWLMGFPQGWTEISSGA